jgi:hypothetical protein
VRFPENTLTTLFCGATGLYFAKNNIISLRHRRNDPIVVVFLPEELWGRTAVRPNLPNTMSHSGAAIRYTSGGSGTFSDRSSPRTPCESCSSDMPSCMNP